MASSRSPPQSAPLRRRKTPWAWICWPWPKATTKPPSTAPRSRSLWCWRRPSRCTGFGKAWAAPAPPRSRATAWASIRRSWPPRPWIFPRPCGWCAPAPNSCRKPRPKGRAPWRRCSASTRSPSPRPARRRPKGRSRSPRISTRPAKSSSRATRPRSTGPSPCCGCAAPARSCGWPCRCRATAPKWRQRRSASPSSWRRPRFTRRSSPPSKTPRCRPPTTPRRSSGL